ncbi:MAG: LysR family transcriptional regulator [Pseudomonadales bacterium]
MSRIDALQVFVAVAEARSFTVAARRIGLTPSAVSKQISHLEERLGTRLLIRTTRSVSLTEGGEMFHERARRILEQLEEAESLVSELDGVPRGRLKLVAEPLFGRAILARIFREFMSRYPEVQVDVTLADDAVALIHHGHDLAIHLGPVPESRLVSRRVVNVRLSLCASSSYLEQQGTPTDTVELPHHRIVRVAGHGPSGEPLMPDTALDDVRVESVMTVNDLDMAYHAVLAGIGIALLPRYVIAQDVSAGTVALLFPDVVAPSQDVYIAYPPVRYVSPRTRAFIDFLTAFLTPAEGQSPLVPAQEASTMV